MFESQAFSKLVDAGKPTGEVVAVDQLLARVRGLEGASVNSLVMFENGDQGLVRRIDDQMVEILTFAAGGAKLGSLAVLESDVYRAPVGEALIGRVVNVSGQPIDGGGPIATTKEADVFAPAPEIIERQILDKQLTAGVAIVDALFPFVLGQRIAILGDSKSGKTTFLRQVARSQLGTDNIIVYVMIAKRQVDVDMVLNDFRQSGVMKQAIVVVASSFDSLSQSYLAPYVGCAMAEYLWKNGKNLVVMYDDLSNHAKIYRELSLLARVSPGRDSYPGDMFYAHSSLLERAGKLAANGATLTALPVILTPGDDITAYLPTSVMSITDGQIIFDLQSFRKGIRPAVNVGLSVSRVGGRVQTASWKALSGQLFKKLADYRQAASFAQFGSELSPQARADLALGKAIYEIFKQAPQETYDLNSQYLMLATALAAGGRTSLNVPVLKQKALEKGPAIDPNTDLTPVVQELLALTTIQVAE